MDKILEERRDQTASHLIQNLDEKAFDQLICIYHEPDDDKTLPPDDGGTIGASLFISNPREAAEMISQVMKQRKDFCSVLLLAVAKYSLDGMNEVNHSGE